MSDPRSPPPMQGNLLLALILTLGILVVWETWFAPPPPPLSSSAPESAEAPPAPPAAASASRRSEASASRRSAKKGESEFYQSDSPSLPIRTPSLKGSLSLKGARIDDLRLVKYRQTVEKESPAVQLFSPPDEKGESGYFAEIGWRRLSPSDKTAIPGQKTLWRAPPNAELTPDTPITLTHDNGEGQIFSIRLEVDENYMFTITQTVESRAAQPINLAPSLRILRFGAVDVWGFFILHEGFVGFFSESGLEEYDYDDAAPDKPALFRSLGGWLGITDKYWAAALIPDKERAIAARFAKLGRWDAPIHEAALHLTAPAQKATTRLFAGAKEVARIEDYAETGIARFDLLIDWGWLYFLTKPIFLSLDFFYRHVGSFGLAILLLTVAIKLLFFPLSNASYRTISQMQKLQPEIQKIQEAHPEDWTKRNQAMMQLYQKHQLQPLSGCLPMLLQAPVFFALYKVLFITIEMRHVPFYGWIRDLSAPDPTSLVNLFGLLPFTPPPLLTIGVWPLLMGLTMFVQIKMNPPPPNPVQKTVMAWMPIFLVVILAQFPAGLVIYWVWNNLLSILQQAVMMKRHGVPIMLFDNLFSKRS